MNLHSSNERVPLAPSLTRPSGWDSLEIFFEILVDSWLLQKELISKERKKDVSKVLIYWVVSVSRLAGDSPWLMRFCFMHSRWLCGIG